jgi:uncharacterized protein
MPQFTKYAEGQFCWVDLSTTNIEAAVPFYCNLFGWTSETNPDPQYGGYTFFLKDGQKVAAAAPDPEGSMPSHWNTSINVSDIHKSTQRCEEAGAKVLVPPMDIPGEGTFSCILDPSGASVFLWQPQNMIGAAVASETNAWIWSILNCRDVPAAREFYAQAFGWQVSAPGGPEIPVPYEEFGLNGLRIGGLNPMPDMIPAEVPSFWSVIFAVDNCDAMTKKAESLGGQVWLRNDSSMPHMTFSGINDPTGGAFTIVQIG